MQLLDIVGGVLPGLVYDAAGYKNNGGCTCGCGTKCPEDFMRWSCPDDIGYACGRDLSTRNPPFYGDPVREPPCTHQNVATEYAMLAFIAFIPSACFFFAGVLNMCVVSK